MAARSSADLSNQLLQRDRALYFLSVQKYYRARLLWLRGIERHIGLFAPGFFGGLPVEPSKPVDNPFTCIPLRKGTMVKPGGWVLIRGWL
jgi:hypothetical protein